MLRTYKFRIYPKKSQQEEMQTHLWLSKNLWNQGLEIAKQMYQDFGKFPSRQAYQLISKNSGLHSLTAQNIFIRLDLAIKAKIRRKKSSQKGGFPRFKNIERMRSLHYPQSGFSLNDRKLKVSSFGEMNIKKHREITGKIKTLTLKKESSGKWFAVFIVDQELVQENHGSIVGIDLGLKTFATISDGTIIKNPRQIRKYEKELIKSDQQLSSKKKGSNNRKKAKLKRAVKYEKLKNVRKDFLHKKSTALVHTYSFIALEELSVQKMAEQTYGKSINDAGWREFTNMLSYKAESAGCRVVFVEAKNTTKECSTCGYLSKKELWERQHNCPSCNLTMDRDLNAAKNILARGLKFLNRATAGIAGSYACREDNSSLKQEAHEFIRG